MAVMMKCGHAANATDSTGRPSCAMCIGIHPGADVIDPSFPDLGGRQAQCSCKRLKPSSATLPFFEYCGPESKEATESCTCGYFRVAHEPQGMAGNVPSNRKTVIEQGKCSGFVSRGPREFDRFYCGCRGWD